MIILGIETSCDETAVALLKGQGGGRLRVLKEVVTSQIHIHRKYGGVVPEVAARRHTEIIIPAIEQTLGRRSLKTIDALAVTAGPGLMTSLLVGVETAKVLSYVWEKPVVRVNHIEAHIYSNWLPGTPSRGRGRPRWGTTQATPTQSGRPRPRFPALCLTVSGGHTELILMTGHGRYKLIGRTLDDAAGEAFDKVAKILGLPYPGGPEISKRAPKGDKNAFDFPRPMIEAQNHGFSFAGLKTAVLYKVRDKKKPTEKFKNDIAASFQEAVVETLVIKTMNALDEYKPKSLLLAGGVAANAELRKRLAAASRKKSIPFHVPAPKHTTDNAAMIAAAGYFNAIGHGRGRPRFTPWKKLTADPNWELV